MSSDTSISEAEPQLALTTSEMVEAAETLSSPECHLHFAGDVVLLICAPLQGKEALLFEIEAGHVTAELFHLTAECTIQLLAASWSA